MKDSLPLRLFFACLFLIAMVESFQIVQPWKRQQKGPISLRQSVVVLQSADDENSQPVTPNQLKTLRKELSKRNARKTLASIKYVEDDEDDGKFLSKICELLEDNELAQVRGVSLNNKRRIFQKAEQLTFDLTNSMGREVTMVDMKGHSVSYYCPNSEESKRKIILRSSYQENAWEKSPKKPRDHRGQIIND